MLALAYAEKYSAHVQSLILIGCGSFDKTSRSKIAPIRQKRIEDFIKKHPEHRSDLELTLNEQIMKWHVMTDSFDMEADDFEIPISEPFDREGYQQTWQDMMECQEKGLYPQAFLSINVPVIMLHGEHDPHPGQMTRNTLLKYIPHLEYHEFSRCGHNPEMEKYAKADFFQYIRDWLNV